MAKRAAPEVNPGSMADIAFLLLIFFLVTTTIETDTGLNRKLPPIDDEQVEPPIIKQKNIFTVLINGKNQLLVEDQLMELKDLRKAAISGWGAAARMRTFCRFSRTSMYTSRRLFTRVTSFFTPSMRMVYRCKPLPRASSMAVRVSTR